MKTYKNKKSKPLTKRRKYKYRKGKTKQSGRGSRKEKIRQKEKRIQEQAKTEAMLARPPISPIFQQMKDPNYKPPKYETLALGRDVPPLVYQYPPGYYAAYANMNPEYNVKAFSQPQLKFPVPITEPYSPFQFWSPIFSRLELQELKERIALINANDNINTSIDEFNFRPTKANPVEYHKYYSVSSIDRTNNFLQRWKQTSMCQIVKHLMKNYDTSSNKVYSSGIYQVQDGPQDTLVFNLILCGVFLIIGIISKKLEGQNYYLVIKGGKAIQLALRDSIYAENYSSDDIDLIIETVDESKRVEEHVQNLAQHIANLIVWLFDSQTFPSQISIMENAEKEIVKLSYKKEVGGYKAISDIGFGELSGDTQPFFSEDNLETFETHISQLGQTISFTFPNSKSMLNEKIYLFSKYIKEKESKHDETCDKECLFLLGKFKRSIFPLLDLEILNTKPELYGDERQFEITRNQYISEILQRMGESPEFIVKFNKYLYSV